jgi:hypothetical protein
MGWWPLKSEGLVQFGYRLERKVEKYRNRTTCWRYARTFCLKYGIIGPFYFIFKAFIPFTTTFSLSSGCSGPKKHWSHDIDLIFIKIITFWFAQLIKKSLNDRVGLFVWPHQACQTLISTLLFESVAIFTLCSMRQELQSKVLRMKNIYT